MDALSLRSLIVIVERAEGIPGRIQSLHLDSETVSLPNVPLPLSLKGTEEWLEVAAESCRKPLLAKSKRLLEARGIATATIPAAVLATPDSISELLIKADRLQECMRPAAFDSIGRALTQGIEEAETALCEYTDASHEVETLADADDWVVRLAGERMSAKPGEAKTLAELARRVVELCKAVTRLGIVIAPFPSLDDAVTALVNLNGRVHEYDRLRAAEDVPEEGVSLAGLSVGDASNQLLQATTILETEKARLVREAATVRKQLEMIGAENQDMADTLKEWRQLVPKLKELLDDRRSAARDSLGAATFGVIECLIEWRLPSTDEVPDEELGKAIRKAIECGYRVHMEAPHED